MRSCRSTNANKIFLNGNSKRANAKATKVHNINCEITIMVVIITVLIKYLAKGACDQALVKLYVVNGAKISKLASYSIGWIAAQIAYNNGVTQSKARSQAPITFNLSLKNSDTVFIDNELSYLEQKIDQ